ncbi:MAG: M20/M25/M40 family metallo-hydrolase [Chloroflexota bacterium]|nr:M20/M25/M40 family metallo-hydrolase [Chloroflexota bacterium]
MPTQVNPRWYDDVKEITTRLVKINSISPNVEGENACAAEIYQALEERGLEPAYWEMKGDGRKIVWAMLEGGAVSPDAEKIPTVVLLGHLDVAGVQDYGADLDPFDPQSLQEAWLEQYEKNPDTEEELLRDAGSRDWMFGRGSFDMKSGVAAQIAVMGALAKVRGSLPGNVVMVTTPDEEVESAGTMYAVKELVNLRDARNLDYVGVINSDYTAPREPGDDNRYIYRGTIGKLLVCFYVRGCETHVGEAFRGLDANLIAANLIQETNLNVALCDEADGEITVPPVTQKQRDFKARYDAQTPISAVVHCSCLVHKWTPKDVLVKMVALAGRALSRANHRRIVQWGEYASRQNSTTSIETLGGKVWTYRQLYEAVEEKLGRVELKQQLEEQAFGYVREARRMLGRLSQSEQDFLIDNGQLVGIDSREKSLAIVKSLVEIASREQVLNSREPAIVVYFAPPFFPPIRGDSESRLNQAIAAEVNTGAHGNIQFRGFYPYVSDISYMRVDEAVYKSLPVLEKNFPLWRNRNDEITENLRDEYFIIPFDLIRKLDCDVANIGPWGKEAHGQGERVHKPYSFETVPELIHNVTLRVLSSVAQ